MPHIPYKPIGLVIAAIFAGLASGQPLTERVFSFQHTGSVQDIQEISTVIRAITEMPQLSADPEKRSLTLGGTTAQIGLAEWLFHELDQPVRSRPPEQHEYRMGTDDVVRMYYFPQAGTVQNLWEMATLIRAMTSVPRLFTESSQRAMAVRGTADQIALAEWLFQELNKPASAQVSTTREFRAGADDVVRMFYFPHAETPKNLQEIATLVRSMTEVKRLFTENSHKAVAVRGTVNQMALTEWLCRELSTPPLGRAAAQLNPNSTVHEFKFGSDDVVRVFYLPSVQTVEELQEIATRMRSATMVRRLFTENSHRAIAVRGEARQIAMAEQMAKERE